MGKKASRTRKKGTLQPAQRMPSYQARRRALVSFLGLVVLAVSARAIYLQVWNTDFLRDQGSRRHLRVVEVSAHRGMIVDRQGEPLAMSTPVDSVWVNPQELSLSADALARLAELLDMRGADIRQIVENRADREFVYLKRRIDPFQARKIMSLGITGLALQREYKRYYPSLEVASHVVGFTDVDDSGQEGVELSFDPWLRGEPGSKRVIRDGNRRIVKDVENIAAPRPGKDLYLSLDHRLQFLAYRELKAAVQRHKARAGSAVILDAGTGEILAMVNQPAYNPNRQKDGRRGRYRNRAVTDLFEPGSTAKPFTVAAALELGKYGPATLIETSPGTLRVGKHAVRDIRDYGTIDVSTVIRKSSNVGISKIALGLPRETMWSVFRACGFGEPTETSFPGEAAGQLPDFRHWAKIDQATMAFGYGLSVTPLQLARAYAVLAADGIRRPVSLIKLEQAPEGRRVLTETVARSVRAMLEGVVSPEGTAPRAAIPGYRVAGKTGTVRKSEVGGYSEDRYVSVFAGMAPASRPRLVMVVAIDEPSAGDYYGGLVAAPVFATVMAGALRLLNVPPDNLSEETLRLASLGSQP